MLVKSLEIEYMRNPQEGSLSIKIGVHASLLLNETDPTSAFETHLTPDEVKKFRELAEAITTRIGEGMWA